MNLAYSLHSAGLVESCASATAAAPTAPLIEPEQVATLSKPFPLMLADDGERVRIQTLQGGKGLAKRLTELGLNPGTEVRIVARQGGGLVVARGETRLALGGGMASKILVEAIAR